MPDTLLILIADDEGLLRFSTQCLLEMEGYRVVATEDGAECVEKYQLLGPENIALVILDQQMPVLGGTEAFRRIRAINPSAKVMISSGSIEGRQLAVLEAEGLFGTIPKPYTAEFFLQKVAEALAVEG